jgi:diacylglycerol kinase (ATP)
MKKKEKNMSERIVSHRPQRAKLFFNSTAGKTEESPHQLAEILIELQKWHFLTEVFLVGPDNGVEVEVHNAIKSGINLIVVAGGDGTIDSVAGAMVGSSATLGIIPTGTRNNVAFNLGIPTTISESVALLREGRRLKIDIGYLRSGRANHWFLEAATMGLLSDLYSPADDIQHGDLSQIGNFLSTFVSSTPSRLKLTLEGRERLDTNAYMVLIANMPFIGPRFQISPDVSFNDSHLDVFVFCDMGKLDLISYAMQSTDGGKEDERIKHFRVKQLKIHSTPQMPVLADGVLLNQGNVNAMIYPRALMVHAGEPSTFSNILTQKPNKIVSTEVSPD